MKPEQITAWALDEASPEERQHLEAALLENPQDKLKAEETKAFCDFLLSELRDDSLAFTEEQRSQLKAQPVAQTTRLPSASGTSALKPPASRVTRWNMGGIVRLAVAACVVMGGFWAWQGYSLKREARFVQASAEPYTTVKVQLAPKPDANKQALQTKWLAQKEVVKAEPKPGKLPALVPVAAAAPAPALALSKSQSGMSPNDVGRLKQVQDQNAYVLNYGDAMKADSPSGPLGKAVGQKAAPTTPAPTATGGIGADILSPTLPMSLTANTSMGGIAGGGYGMNDIQQLTLGANANLGLMGGSSNSGSLQSGSVPLTGAASLVKAGTGVVTLGGASNFAEASVVNGGMVAAAQASPPVALELKEADSRYYLTASEASPHATKNLAQKQEASKALRRSDVSGESYTRIVENEMKDVAREPLSTLSIDVDTASYANVRRFLNQNMIPPPDAVRIEELVNYFPTDEEGPAHEAKEPFGVRIELAPCPWQPVHRLARIAIKGREMDRNRKPSNLVFLVDVSGSMNEPAKLPLVQQSLRMLTEQLGEGDRVTMVVYAGSSGVVLPPTSGEKKAEILGAIDKLSAGGSTHGSAGIKLAYEQAVAGFIKGGVNRVILCTDGDFNVGVSSSEELEKLIKHKAKTGVFLSVLGFGSGNLKDRTMETLADKGNGNYAYIDSLSEARKVLVEQMSGMLDTIAKDVKIQVEFNPAQVRSYRLIGYENRLLAKEDFNDDTKDAGEIGAGHSVVALYEVVPATLPTGAESRTAVDSLKYQTPVIPPVQLAEAAKSGEVMTVKLRYKEPDSDLSKLIEAPVKDEGKTLTASSAEYKFSAAVAGFGLLLRDSSYKGTLSWETVRRLAMDGKGADKLGYRGEFLQLIDKARGLKETQN